MLTQEDLDFRKTRIGASDASAILNINPWKKTPYKLWLEKEGLEKPTSNMAMLRGNLLEPLALDEFEKQTGVAMMPNRRVINPKRDWQFATLDGVSITGEVIVEIKCGSKDVHELAKQKKLPDYYFAQVQHQLDVCGLDMGFYFSFNGKEGAIVEVKRDQAFIDEMAEQEYNFWKNHVLTHEPPELCADDFMTRDDKEWIELEKSYINWTKILKEAEKKQKEAREGLINLCGKQNSSGKELRVLFGVKKGFVDYDSIPELKNVNKENYRKPSVPYCRVDII